MDHLTDSMRYSFNGISWCDDSDSCIDLIKFLAMLNVKAAQIQYNAYRAGGPFRINWVDGK
jgi:hypothetical protein